MNFDPTLGVRRLYELFQERSLPPSPELQLLDARLRHNLSKQIFGDHPANSAERFEIIYGLIQLTNQEFGLNFNDLCNLQPMRNESGRSVRSKGNEEETDEPPVPDYTRRQNWAIFVGVNTYENQVYYPPLQVCVTDATVLAQQFVTNGFLSEYMHVITDASVDNRPSRGNILNTLQTTAAATRPDDLLLFYYSGHGDVEGDESYLVCRDGWADSLENTALSFSRVKQIMQKAPARNKVIILDACHTGAQIGSKGKVRMSPAFIRHVFEQAEGIAILSSCTQNQISYESSKRGQSAYTYFLLQALQGHADKEEKGVVTVRDLNNYVTDKVKAWAAQQKCIQSPTISAEMIGEIVVCSYASTR
jgi:Caspase domain